MLTNWLFLPCPDEGATPKRKAVGSPVPPKNGLGRNGTRAAATGPGTGTTHAHFSSVGGKKLTIKGFTFKQVCA